LGGKREWDEKGARIVEIQRKRSKRFHALEIDKNLGWESPWVSFQLHIECSA